MLMWTLSPLGFSTALLAIVGVLGSVLVTRPKRERDTDERIADLTQKVRAPWRYRLTQAKRLIER